jgi:pyridoxamine 5'-phosphate oxidase
MIAAMARHGHDPIAKFIRWLEDARRSRIPNYEAMALATAARSGKTSVRFVLLKGIDQRGFMFFTDARSRKGRECAAIRTGRSPATLVKPITACLLAV